jgi:hypothetical protein
LEIQPGRLESPAGSTPLRLRVDGGPEEYLFESVAYGSNTIGTTAVSGNLTTRQTTQLPSHPPGADYPHLQPVLRIVTHRLGEITAARRAFSLNLSRMAPACPER